MKALLILAFASAGFLLGACSQNKSVNLSEEKIEAELQKIEVDQAEKAEEATAEEDSVWRLPYNTAHLDDAINYFKANNKYKDWDPKDPKKVLLSAVIEKDGTPTDITIRKTSGVEKLDEEAIRLVRNGKISPALNESKKPVRSLWYISIPFPPQ